MKFRQQWLWVALIPAVATVLAAVIPALLNKSQPPNHAPSGQPTQYIGSGSVVVNGSNSGSSTVNSAPCSGASGNAAVDCSQNATYIQVQPSKARSHESGGTRCQISAIDGKPRLRTGADPFCEFDDNHLLVWGDVLIKKLANVERNYGISLDRDGRLAANVELRQEFGACCYPSVRDYHDELTKRMIGGAGAGGYSIYNDADPHAWHDSQAHWGTVEDIRSDLEARSEELKKQIAGNGDASASR